MTPDTIDLTVEKSIQEHGLNNRLIALVKELSELQWAVWEYLNTSRKEDFVDGIRAEVADVLYCLHYLRGVTDNTWKDYMEMATDRATENQERLNERVKE